MMGAFARLCVQACEMNNRGDLVREPEQQTTLDLAPTGATATTDTLARRFADFESLGEALDYAALGRRGMNFHDARGTLVRAYPYAELREDALTHARRFLALGLAKGDRVALVAETGPEFAACFFGAVYAGAWPVPLPLPTSFGGREAYVDQLAVQLRSSDPKLFIHPTELADFCSDAADKAGVAARDWESLAQVEAAPVAVPTTEDKTAWNAYLNDVAGRHMEGVNNSPYVYLVPPAPAPPPPAVKTCTKLERLLGCRDG